MDGAIQREEHEEFARRIEDEDRRQNRRIEALEENVKQIGELTQSVNRLAVNMDSMLKELEKQGGRLEELEGRDGEMWRKVTGYALTAAVGILVGFVFTRLGM